MADRRRHKRVGLVREVSLAPIQRKKEVKALVVNVSRSGLELYGQTTVPQGTEVVVRMLFMDEDGIDKPEVIAGKVKWSKLLSGNYVVGVEFNDLNERDHFMLLAYIRYAEGFEAQALDE